jgi:hypothetical protein
LLEVVALEEAQRGLFCEYLVQRVRGDHPIPEFDTYRGKRLRFVWRGPSVHMDSKLWPKPAKRKRFGAAPLELVSVTVEKHALTLMRASTP